MSATPLADVTVDCPGGCDRTHRIVWPPDDPDTVELYCVNCDVEFEVNKAGDAKIFD